MKKLFATYGGIALGAAYGFLMRLLFEDGIRYFNFDGLFSVTFVGIVPLAIGVTCMLFASRTQLDSWVYRAFTPVVAVLLFFLCCFWSGKEDIICILVMSFPFLLIAAVGGLVAGWAISRYRRRNGTLYTILLLPLLVGVAEPQVPADVQLFHISNSVVINAPPPVVWANVVRVPQIADAEYKTGFFNYAGIPRPLYAVLDVDTLGGTRTGHFEGGLKFVEEVTRWERNRYIGFNIRVVPSSVRPTVFDQHILSGKHVRLVSAAYSLRPLDGRHTELTLTSGYELTTHINAYGSWWGNTLLADFQQRLLNVIKHRCNAVR